MRRAGKPRTRGIGLSIKRGLARLNCRPLRASVALARSGPAGAACHADDFPAVGMLEVWPVMADGIHVNARPAYLLTQQKLAAPVEFRCFRSTGAGKPVLLQFEFPQEKRAPGYVSYQRGSGKIPVQLVSTHSEETAPGRPLEFTTTWKEIVKTGPQGTYTLVTQGARIYGFSFVRGKDRRRFEFEEDPDAAGEQGCTWKP